MPKEFACRKCKALTPGRVCPKCNSTELSVDWTGLIVILDAERSVVAKTLNIDKSGRYALKVS